MFHDTQVNFYVKDVEASVRFYTEMFGFKETFRHPVTGTPDHVELRLDGLLLGLASIEAARTVHGLPAGSGPARAEICLWTDDVDQVYADLIAKGAPSLSEPHDFLGRLRVAWFIDPDGTPVQIVADQKVAVGD